MKRIDVIGFGPGNYESMTLEAVAALKEADVIIGYTTYVKLLKGIFPEKKYMETGMTREIDRCRLALEEAEKGQCVGLVSSGDSGIYGMAGIMLQVIQAAGTDVQVRTIAGVTAASAGAARLGAPLMNDFAVISLSDLMTPMSQIRKRLRAAAQGDFVICLYNPKSRKRRDHLAEAVDIIQESRKGETPVGLVHRAGRENEFCEIVRLDELKQADVDMFTTVIIGNSMTYVWEGRMITPRGYVLEAM